MYADPVLAADVLIVKLRDLASGTVCVFQLPSDFSACDATYFQDYSNYNASIWGIPVDVGVLGLDNQDARDRVPDRRVLRRVRR